jgi:sensor domain CHASE-containing protein
VWRKAFRRLAEVRRRSDDERARALGAAPIGIVVLVAIICVVVAVLTAAERADDVELQQEQKLLTQAIADRGRRVMRELENVAASNDIVLQLHYNFDPDWVHHLIGLRLATFFDHEHVFVVDRTDGLTYALSGNQSATRASIRSASTARARISTASSTCCAIAPPRARTRSCWNPPPTR